MPGYVTRSHKTSVKSLGQIRATGKEVRDMIIMKNNFIEGQFFLLRHSSHGHRGSKRRELAQHAH